MPKFPHANIGNIADFFELLRKTEAEISSDVSWKYMYDHCSKEEKLCNGYRTRWASRLNRNYGPAFSTHKKLYRQKRKSIIQRIKNTVDHVHFKLKKYIYLHNVLNFANFKPESCNCNWDTKNGVFFKLLFLNTRTYPFLENI